MTRIRMSLKNRGDWNMYYFDHSATTPPSRQALDVMVEVAQTYYANPSSIHQLGERSKALLQQSREQVASLLGYKPSEVYFASSGTEVNNWVFRAILPALRDRHSERRRLIVSAVEHPSITSMLSLLVAEDYEVQLAPVDSNGVIDLKVLEAMMDQDVLLVSTMVVNNEIGSLQPIDELSKVLKQYPQTIWHVDAVQAVTTQFERMLNPRIDLVSLSSHKFHAPRGVGILAKRKRVPSQPMLYGGGQETGLRSSTENLPAIVATAKALRLAHHEQKAARAKLTQLREQIVRQLKSLDWHIFAGATGITASEHIICAALPGVPGEVLVHSLETEGVIVSTTSACSSRSHQAHHTLKSMNIATDISESAIRISLSQTTHETEVAALLEALAAVTTKFNQAKKGI